MLPCVPPANTDHGAAGTLSSIVAFGFVRTSAARNISSIWLPSKVIDCVHQDKARQSDYAKAGLALATRQSSELCRPGQRDGDAEWMRQLRLQGGTGVDPTKLHFSLAYRKVEQALLRRILARHPAGER